MSNHHIPFGCAADIDYAREAEASRVEQARKRIDAGDVIAIVESRLAQESDPAQHSLYPMVLFFLDRQTAVDGGKFYDHWRQLILAAIDTALDDLLELED